MKVLGMNVLHWSGWDFWRNFTSPEAQARAAARRMVKRGHWTGPFPIESELSERTFTPHVVNAKGVPFLVVQISGKIDVIPKPSWIEGGL